MRKLLALILLGGLARAADHRDGPAALADPTTDVTDVYAWMSADGARAYLVMDIQGANLGATSSTRFSDSALYVLHLNSGTKYGDTNPKSDRIICKFSSDATQQFQCWGPGSEYVKGSTGDSNGIQSGSGKMKVFAGVRNDPFWFNIQGFRKLGMAVKAAAGSLTFDGAGCPAIDATTSAALVGLLASDGNGGAAKDDFAKSGHSPVDGTSVTNGNVLSIAIAIDKTLLTAGGPIVGVWGSTNQAK
jgi:Domain of unknown function (DUF4331)